VKNPLEVTLPDETFCATCDHVMSPYYARCPQCEGRRNRTKVDALATVIRALKASVEVPEGDSDELEYLKQRLVELDHPYPNEFLAWLDEARAAASKSRSRRR
jgi:uncharacterized OB-fold protein